LFHLKTLILWDIDGTLIASGGAGVRALQTALRNTFGENGLINGIEFSGRTDPWIIRQIFARFGIPPTTENFARYFEAYLAVLPGEMAKPGARILPGVREVLEAADARGDVAQGLLTGNIRRGAEAKLSHHRLWHHFPFGAFADDSEVRNELGPHALRRARERHGVDFAADHVWVIGDTPHDIACARAFGARCIAVATGGHGAAELASHSPAAILPDLADAGAFWEIVDRAGG
jgi:phosphoglycolate phosphatase-like HAD superfamily hydrolase